MSKITDQKDLFEKMFGHGIATFSIVSKVTGDRKTFQFKRIPAREGEEQPLKWWVSQLSGPDNNLDFTYLFMIDSTNGNPTIILTAKSPQGGWQHIGVRAAKWLFENAVAARDDMGRADIYLACDCQWCGRLLTVPESIMRKAGPVCAGRG